MARTALRLAAPRDETGVFEDLEVLRDRLQRDREGLGEFVDGRVALREAGDKATPSRVRESGEGAIEPVLFARGESVLCHLFHSFLPDLNSVVTLRQPIR